MTDEIEGLRRLADIRRQRADAIRAKLKRTSEDDAGPLLVELVQLNKEISATARAARDADWMTPAHTGDLR